MQRKMFLFYSINVTVIFYTNLIGAACPYCNETFARRTQLTRHINSVHINESERRNISHKKSLQCSYCNKMFSRREYVARHMLSHTEGERLQCPYCAKNLSNIYFIEHIKRAHKDRYSGGSAERYMTPKMDVSVVCQYCHQKYPSKKKLADHETAHTSGASTWPPCPICKLKFSRRHLPYHIEREHRNNQKAQLDDISSGPDWSEQNKIYKKRRPMRPKQSVSEKSRESCPRCNKIFNTKQTLLRHVKLHETAAKVEPKILPVVHPNRSGHKTVSPVANDTEKILPELEIPLPELDEGQNRMIEDALTAQGDTNLTDDSFDENYLFALLFFDEGTDSIDAMNNETENVDIQQNKLKSLKRHRRDEQKECKRSRKN